MPEHGPVGSGERVRRRGHQHMDRKGEEPREEERVCGKQEAGGDLPLMHCWKGRRERYTSDAKRTCRRSTGQFSSTTMKSSGAVMHAEAAVTGGTVEQMDGDTPPRAQGWGDRVCSQNSTTLPRRSWELTRERAEAQTEGGGDGDKLQGGHLQEVEIFSASSTTSSLVAQDLSVSSLPPMGATTTTEGSNPDGSGSSGREADPAPPPSQPDKSGGERGSGGGDGGGGGGSKTRRRRTGRSPRKRQGTADGCERRRYIRGRS